MSDPYEIAESNTGTFFYHITSKLGDRGIALCGEKKLMKTSLPIGSWGFKSSHIGERYCKVCEEKYRASSGLLPR